ncbi:NitT/TauT family transport system ATP-binding protein OS=Castellaniella defragrans OX=75697 GN=HNR28_000909 PE=4 SV=1 [Castellaniella defragrans]
MAAEFLELKNVSKTYSVRKGNGLAQRVDVVRDVSHSVSEGRFVTVVGPSGCGKSTLLGMIAGLTRATSGSLLLKGREIVSPHPSLGMVFQEESIFPWLNAVDNVAFGLEMQGVERRKCQDRAIETLHLVGLQGFEYAFPRELSGGMRQRVAIARALALDPDVLLMDEPFAAVDPQTRMFIGSELRRIWKESGKTVIFITHDINEAVYLSQEIWVMSGRPGTILETVQVDLPEERDISVLSSDAFAHYTGYLWRTMQAEWESSQRTEGSGTLQKSA